VTVASMTGFGRAEVAADRFSLTVEARSVNSRHLDIALRLPPALAAVELEARRLIQSRLERGRVDVHAQVAAAGGLAAPEVRVDSELARRYVEQAQEVGREIGLAADVSLAWVLDQPGVLRVEERSGPDPAALAPCLLEALGQALDELVARRTTEGAALAAELRALHVELGAQLEGMRARAPLAAQRRAERVRERLRALLADVAVDEARVLTEAAAWAIRTDVTEELTRLRAHLDEFAVMLDKGGPVGRRFDFLLQELGREVNTVAAKADDLELSQATLVAKGLLEKIREQVQNLE
jgi:uncharacterized protein (TIGR00255 family)